MPCQAIDSAFISVCASGDTQEFNLLLSQGADVNGRLDGQQVEPPPVSTVKCELVPEQEGSEGFTALMWAAYGGQQDLVVELIKKGADIEAKSDRG
eukprot:761918-Hanusia_phi.AAC.2